MSYILLLRIDSLAFLSASLAQLGSVTSFFSSGTRTFFFTKVVNLTSYSSSQCHHVSRVSGCLIYVLSCFHFTIESIYLCSHCMIVSCEIHDLTIERYFAFAFVFHFFTGYFDRNASKSGVSALSM